MRSHADRDALATGVRVQLSWVKHAPYTQHADLAIADRLATVSGRDGSVWLVVDEHGGSHRLDDDELAEHEPDPARGRWRIDGAIPAYRVGERLRLTWRHRSTAFTPDPPRADCDAVVIAEQASTVRLRLEDGREILMFRSGAQADEPDRAAARWFVIGRG